MNLGQVRLLFLAVANGVAGFLGGAILFGFPGAFVVALLFLLVALAVMFVGLLFRHPIHKFRSREFSSRSILILWGVYGLIHSAVLSLALFVPSDLPVIPVATVLGMQLLFTLFQQEVTDLWRILIQLGVISLLTVFYLGAWRYPVAVLYVVLLVYGTTVLHYSDRLEEAGFREPVGAGRPLLFATLMNIPVLLVGVLGILFFPDRTVPLAYRWNQAEPPELISLFGENPVGREALKNISGSFETPDGATMFVGVAILLVFLVLTWVLIRRLFQLLQGDQESVQKEESDVEESPFGAARPTLQNLERTRKGEEWKPSEGSNRERVIRRYLEFARRMKGRGWERASSETPGQFLRRFSSGSGDIKDVEGIISVFERARYGTGELSDREANQFEERLQKLTH